MKGATEFNRLIQKAYDRKLGSLVKTKVGYNYHGGNAECFQNGDIIYVTASHARGKTFFIYLIDENNKLFEVYGVKDGNLGWSETYGWTHKGTWVKPILQYFKNLEREIIAHDEAKEKEKREKECEENEEIGKKIKKFNAMFRCS